jgi:hypothetical protein
VKKNVAVLALGILETRKRLIKNGENKMKSSKTLSIAFLIGLLLPSADAGDAAAA